MISKQTVYLVYRSVHRRRVYPPHLTSTACVLAFPKTMRPHAIGAELPAAGSEVQEGSAGTSGGVQ